VKSYEEYGLAGKIEPAQVEARRAAMETSRHFIYIHRAKFAWKRFKHRAGVLTGIEKPEGAEKDRPVSYSHVRPDEYLVI
jgi:hypothetical protein